MSPMNREEVFDRIAKHAADVFDEMCGGATGGDPSPLYDALIVTALGLLHCSDGKPSPDALSRAFAATGLLISLGTPPHDIMRSLDKASSERAMETLISQERGQA